MNPKTKFKLKSFLLYEVLEPFESKFKLTSNLILWSAIIISFVWKLLPLFVGAIILKVILHAYTEWKSGKFIYFVRMRDDKIRKWKDAMTRMRKEKREKMLESEVTTNNSEQNKLNNPINK